MQIIRYPHPSLRWKASDVTRIDSRLREIVEDMFDLMYESKGIGLAAPQVHLPLRLFVMNPSGDPDDEEGECVLINPQIVARKGSAVAEEGCLSLPELFAEVRRPEQVTIEFFDLEGQQYAMRLDDLPARVAQHELDHLDGVLFIDRISESAMKELSPRLREFDAEFREQQAKGAVPSDEALRVELESLAAALTQE